jgi:hypothetical protein
MQPTNTNASQTSISVTTNGTSRTLTKSSSEKILQTAINTVRPLPSPRDREETVIPIHHNQNVLYVRQQSLQSPPVAPPTITTATTMRSQSVDLSSPNPNVIKPQAQKIVKFRFDESSTDPNDQNVSREEFVTKLIDNRTVTVQNQVKHDDGRIEKYLVDGSIQTQFPNGTIKETNPAKDNTYVQFYNGDYKHVDHSNHIETYYYAQTNVTQIKYESGCDAGLQIFKFPNGQIEKHHLDNTKEILFPDKTVKYIYTNGTEETRLPNGTNIKLNTTSGHKVIDYPNKQREIHTQDYKRREYPDGSLKTVYSNGMSETRYANGRVRVKDELGKIISDSLVQK